MQKSARRLRGLVVGVLAIGAAWLGSSISAQRSALASPPAGPPVETVVGGSSCPLSVDDQVKAVTAFGAMLPVFRHPRCLNCHGGVDPMSQQHAGFEQLEPTIDPVTDIERFLAQCQQCHDELPGWRTPGEPRFFVGKDDEEMCLQMKRFEPTAESFISHIHDDHGGVQFIKAGFDGDRALGQQGLKDYDLHAEPPPGTQAELTDKARKWVAAMGGTYAGSPECGCVMPKIKLEIQHRSAHLPASPSFSAGWVGFDGDVNFEIILLPRPLSAGRIYSGEISLVRQMKVQFAAHDCSGTASETEHWFFGAEVDQSSGTMKLTFGFITDGEVGEAECNTRGHISHPQINPDLFHELEEIVVPLHIGATKEETLPEEFGRAQEWLVVKVKETPE
jgi:hypothetical protein